MRVAVCRVSRVAVHRFNAALLYVDNDTLEDCRVRGTPPVEILALRQHRCQRCIGIDLAGKRSLFSIFERIELACELLGCVAFGRAHLRRCTRSAQREGSGRDDGPKQSFETLG